MATRELITAEVEPSSVGPLPIAIVKIDGDNTGAYLYGPHPTYGMAMSWVALEYAFNLRLAFDLPKYIWTSTLFSYLTGTGKIPVAVPKP